MGLLDRFPPPCRSDQSVHATLLRYCQVPSFLTTRIPIRPFQAEFTIFTEASTQGRVPLWGIPRFWVFGPIQTASSISAVWNSSGYFGPPSLGYSAMGPPSYERFGQHYSSVLHQQTGRDPFPYPVLGLVWLQTRDIAIRTRHILGCLNLISDHLSWPNQPITTEWSLHPEILT